MSKDTHHTSGANQSQLELPAAVTIAVAELASAARQGLLALAGRHRTAGAARHARRGCPAAGRPQGPSLNCPGFDGAGACRRRCGRREARRGAVADLRGAAGRRHYHASRPRAARPRRRRRVFGQRTGRAPNLPLLATCASQAGRPPVGDRCNGHQDQGPPPCHPAGPRQDWHTLGSASRAAPRLAGLSDVGMESALGRDLWPWSRSSPRGRWVANERPNRSVTSWPRHAHWNA